MRRYNSSVPVSRYTMGNLHSLPLYYKIFLLSVLIKGIISPLSSSLLGMIFSYLVFFTLFYIILMFLTPLSPKIFVHSFFIIIGTALIGYIMGIIIWMIIPPIGRIVWILSMLANVLFIVSIVLMFTQRYSE